MMGLEEHLISMFPHDFKFVDGRRSHLGDGAPSVNPTGEPVWTPDGEAELHKIPFFVRGKVRRNTETFARERGITAITAETLYDAKAHYSR